MSGNLWTEIARAGNPDGDRWSVRRSKKTDCVNDASSAGSFSCQKLRFRLSSLGAPPLQHLSELCLKWIGQMGGSPTELRRELQTKAGETVVIHVQWPSPSPKRSDEFQCIYGIETSEKTAKRTAYGIDQVQALYLALRGLHALISKLNSERSDGDKIFWFGGMHADDLGLPRYDTD